MLAILENGVIVAIRESLNGQDMNGRTAVAVPEGFDPVAMSHQWQGGQWVENLTAYKAALIATVNTHAEDVRNRFLTPGSGQAITYTRKEAEAREYLLNGGDPADFPFLAAEATATNSTIGAIAALVAGQADAWLAVGATIEGKRRGLVVAIEAATTKAGLDSIDIVSGWPSA